MFARSQCFFKKDESCNDALISLYDLRHEIFSKTLFPDAQSCVEIMLLRSDLFYETKLRLRKTYVCTLHKEELLKEYRVSKYRSCFVCVRGFGKSSASAAIQNISRIVALTVYEQLHLQRSYGMPICRRCREEVLKCCDEVISFYSSTKFIVDAVVEFLAGDYANDVLRDLYLGESRKSKQYKIFYCCDYNMIFYCRKE